MFVKAKKTFQFQEKIYQKDEEFEIKQENIAKVFIALGHVYPSDKKEFKSKDVEKEDYLKKVITDKEEIKKTKKTKKTAIKNSNKIEK